MNIFSKFFKDLIEDRTEKYKFTLGSNEKTSDQKPFDDMLKNQKVYPSIDVNLEYVHSRFNSLINSDIIIREFIINVKGKQFKAFILYIDGMVNKNSISDFILNPLMLKNYSNQFDGPQVISEAVASNIMVRKVKKFNITDYIFDSLLPQNDVQKVDSFDKIADDVSSRKLCFIC